MNKDRPKCRGCVPLKQACLKAPDPGWDSSTADALTGECGFNRLVHQNVPAASLTRRLMRPTNVKKGSHSTSLQDSISCTLSVHYTQFKVLQMLPSSSLSAPTYAVEPTATGDWTVEHRASAPTVRYCFPFQSITTPNAQLLFVSCAASAVRKP